MIAPAREALLREKERHPKIRQTRSERMENRDAAIAECHIDSMGSQHCVGGDAAQAGQGIQTCEGTIQVTASYWLLGQSSVAFFPLASPGTVIVLS